MRTSKDLIRVPVLAGLVLLGTVDSAPGEPWENPLLDPAYVEVLRSDKGIYGEDDRIELYQATEAAQKAAAATAGFVWPQALESTGSGWRVVEAARQPLGEAQGLCKGERFAEQPSAAYCSGFLIDQDLLATAGHCVGGRVPACRDLILVFGYALSGPGAPRFDYPREDVYRCREVVTRVLEQREDQRFDWAVIRLDRPVTGRDPVVVWGEEPAPDEALAVIGHPLGLPSKIASGGRVQRSADATPVFVTDLDTYQGNSGSAVFTLSSIQRGDPEVVGILVAGAEDWDTPAGQVDCKRSARCAGLDPSARSGERCAGEEVTKTRWVVRAVEEALNTPPVGEAAETQPGKALDELLPGLFRP